MKVNSRIILSVICILSLMFLSIGSVSAVADFSDNFNDCDISDWETVYGTISAVNTAPSWDGTCYAKLSGGGGGEIRKLTSSLYRYWEWVVYAPVVSNPAIVYIKSSTLIGSGSGIGNNTRIQLVNTSTSILTVSIAGSGVTSGSFTMANTHQWTKITVFEDPSLTQYTVKAYYPNGSYAGSMTQSYTTYYPAISMLMQMPNNGYAAFDNIIAREQNAGTALLIAPATITLNMPLNVSYFLYDQDIALYNYSIDIYDTTGLASSIGIGTNVNGSVVYPTLGKLGGTYYAYMVATLRSNGVKYYLAVTSTFVDSSVSISGYTRNAITGAAVASTDVSFFQLGTWFNTTSDANGFYSISSLQVGYPITINASHTNYTHFAYTYTPSYYYNYTVNIYLWPSNAHPGTTGIEGLVLKSPFRQAISSATINAWNTTNNYSFSSDINGYWSQQLADASDSFNVNATKTGYTTSSANTSITSMSWSQVILSLDPIYHITITAKDSVTGAFLSTFTATINDANSTILTTTTSSITFTEPQGLYLITVTNPNYLSSSQFTLLTTDINLVFTLTPYSSGGTGINNTIGGTIHNIYDPLHQVQFIVTDYWMWIKYYNVNVTATDPMGNVSTGITDSYGSVVFWMNSTIPYAMTIVNVSQGINYAISIYPIINPYYLRLPLNMGNWHVGTNGSDELSSVNVTVTTSVINATAATITVNYTDTTSQTSNLMIYLNTSSASDPMNQTVLQSQSGGSNAVYSKTFTVNNYGCINYYINVYSTVTSFGNIKRFFGITFPGGQCAPTVGSDINPTLLFYIAIGFLIFVAGFAGATSHVTISAVLVVLGWIFQGWGWLNGVNVNIVAGLTLATIVVVIMMINERSKQEGV